MRASRFSPGTAGSVAALLIVAVVLLLGARYGQGQSSAAQIPAEQTVQVQKPKKFQGRLPSYYGTVVNEAQRQAIYTIQKRYFTRIEELKAELESLTKKRNDEVASVLSPQQQVEIDDLKATAKAKRDAKKKTATPAKP